MKKKEEKKNDDILVCTLYRMCNILVLKHKNFLSVIKYIHTSRMISR